MNNYTVYKHIFPNNKIYIGITNQKTRIRWGNGHGYAKQCLIYNAIQKYEWHNIEHKVLYTDLTKQEAENIEIQLIKEYKSNKREYGYNISNGGNCIGTHSEETKLKIKLGNQKPKKKGWKHTEQTKSIMREKSLGEKNHNYGKPMLPKVKELLLLNCLNITRKKVIQYDKNMNIINKFKGVREAGRLTNRYSSNVSHCCRTGALTKDGYYFRFN